MDTLIENLKSTLLLLARLGCDLRAVFCLGQNACAVLRDCVPSQRADYSVTVPPDRAALCHACRHSEELDKICQQLLPVQQGHGRTERRVHPALGPPGSPSARCLGRASTAARRTPGPLLPTPLAQAPQSLEESYGHRRRSHIFAQNRPDGLKFPFTS